MTALRWLSVSSLLGALGVSACGETNDVKPQSRVVKDAAGRSCSLNEDTERITCNATPMPSITCSAGESACFTLGSFGSNRAAAVCAGCCRGASSTSVARDCSPMLCGGGGECPTGSRCSGNNCIR